MTPSELGDQRSITQAFVVTLPLASSEYTVTMHDPQTPDLLLPPTVATQHPSWMSPLENVSATFLCPHLGATSSIQGTLCGIHDQAPPHSDLFDLLRHPT